MANSILSVAANATQHTPQYHLPQADRQAILAQSDFSQQRAEVERQRRAFVSKFGFEFGQIQKTTSEK